MAQLHSSNLRYQNLKMKGYHTSDGEWMMTILIMGVVLPCSAAMWKQQTFNHFISLLEPKKLSHEIIFPLAK